MADGGKIKMYHSWGFTSVRKKTEFLDQSLKTIDIFPNRSEALIIAPLCPLQQIEQKKFKPEMV